MPDADMPKGSGRLIEKLNLAGAPQSTIDHVKNRLRLPASNGDLIDLLYEQMGVNIKIGNAVTQLLSDSDEKKFEAVNDCLDSIRSQAQSFEKLYAKILLVDDDTSEAGE